MTFVYLLMMIMLMTVHVRLSQLVKYLLFGFHGIGTRQVVFLYKFQVLFKLKVAISVVELDEEFLLRHNCLLQAKPLDFLLILTL